MENDNSLETLSYVRFAQNLAQMFSDTEKGPGDVLLFSSSYVKIGGLSVLLFTLPCKHAIRVTYFSIEVFSLKCRITIYLGFLR